MSDNVPINAGAGTNVATDEIGGVHHQRFKIEYGTDGSATDVSTLNPLPVQDLEVSTYHLVTAGSTNAANIKSSAALLRGVYGFNNAAYPIFVKFHNTAGTPTAGAGVVFTVGVQAGVRFDLPLPGRGRAFGSGLGITVVKDIADTGTTAVLANDAQIEVAYA